MASQGESLRLMLEAINAMQAGRWTSSSMPTHYTREIEASRNAIARWYDDPSQQDDQKEVAIEELELDPNPLSEFGLAPP